MNGPHEGPRVPSALPPSGRTLRRGRDLDITPKVTRGWTNEDSRRTLVLARDEAPGLIGERLGCRNLRDIDLRLDRVPSVRKGDLSKLVWIPLDPNPGELHPCRLSSDL